VQPCQSSGSSGLAARGLGARGLHEGTHVGGHQMPGGGGIDWRRRMVVAAFGARRGVDESGEEGIWEGKSVQRCKARLGSFYRVQMGGEAAGGGEWPAVEWNFNAFKVSVSRCNGRRRLCQLWEGKGWARVALELAWKRWLDGAAVG
jgi:hypothetical protein